jgi:hypothetical protein
MMAMAIAMRVEALVVHHRDRFLRLAHACSWKGWELDCSPQPALLARCAVVSPRQKRVQAVTPSSRARM